MFVLKPMPGTRDDTAFVGFADYLDTVLSRRWIILSVCAVTMLTTFLYARRQKTMYRATATFLAAEPAIMKSQGLFLDSILRNNPRFLQANALNPELLDPLLTTSFDVPGADTPIVLLDYLGIDDGSLEDRLYSGRAALAAAIEVNIPDGRFPFLLAVNVKLDSPQVGSQIANRLVEQFVGADLTLQARRASERTSFIESLVEDVGVDLRIAEDRLEKYKDSNRLSSSISVVAEVARLERDLETQSALFVRLRKEELLYNSVGQEGGSAISMVEKARPPREPYTMGVGAKVGLAGLGSLLLAVVLACFAESLARRRFR